jgi:D-sedoheptulose 7-phosphate isomerase
MFLNNYIDQMFLKTKIIDNKIFLEIIEKVKTIKKTNKKIIIVGNGGSSAIASHVSVDLTKAAKVRAINFNESDLITCFGNDYGYENWVKEALRAYADLGDLIILISSSGKSPNILNAALYCKELGYDFITLSGFDIDNPLKKIGNINLWVDSNSYNIVEMAHHIWLLAIVDYIIENSENQLL